MPNKPTTVPSLDTNETNRVAPVASKVTDGYVANDTLPASNANYLWGWAGDWLSWLDANFADGNSADDLRISPPGSGDLEVDTDLVPVGDSSHQLGINAERWSVGYMNRLEVGPANEIETNYSAHVRNESLGGGALIAAQILTGDTTGITRRAARFAIQESSGVTGNAANVYGVSSVYSKIQANTVDNAIMVRSAITCTEASEVTRFASFEAQYYGTVALTATDMYGLYLSDLPSAFVVTNQYGIYLEDLDEGANSYGLWIQGAGTEAIHVQNGLSVFCGVQPRQADNFDIGASANRWQNVFANSVNLDTTYRMEMDAAGPRIIFDTNDRLDYIRAAGTGRWDWVIDNADVASLGATELALTVDIAPTVTETHICGANARRWSEVNAKQLFVGPTNQETTWQAYIRNGGTAIADGVLYAHDDQFSDITGVTRTGVYSHFQTNSATSGAATLLRCFRSFLQLNQGTPTADSAIGYAADAYISKGPITRYAGFESDLRGLSDPGVTTAYHVYLHNAEAGVDVGTQYGLYLEDMTGGGANYGLWIAGASTEALRVDSGLSVFGGNVRPKTTETYNLGSNSLRWSDAYVERLEVGESDSEDATYQARVRNISRSGGALLCVQTLDGDMTGVTRRAARFAIGEGAFVTGNAENVYGVSSVYTKIEANSVDNVIMYRSAITCTEASTITRFAAFESQHFGTEALTATDWYGLFVNNLPSAFVVTNQYGIYLEDLDEGANSYGIWIEGAGTEAIHVQNGLSVFCGVQPRQADNFDIGASDNRWQNIFGNSVNLDTAYRLEMDAAGPRIVFDTNDRLDYVRAAGDGRWDWVINNVDVASLGATQLALTVDIAPTVTETHVCGSNAKRWSELNTQQLFVGPTGQEATWQAYIRNGGTAFEDGALYVHDDQYASIAGLTHDVVYSHFQTNAATSGAASLIRLFSSYFHAQQGTATVDSAIGYNADAYISKGPVTRYAGFESTVRGSLNPGITNVYHFIANDCESDVGVVNQYGVYVAGMTGATNNYGIRIGSVTGTVGIGLYIADASDAAIQVQSGLSAFGGGVVPLTHNGSVLGGSDRRWGNVYSGALNVLSEVGTPVAFERDSGSQNDSTWSTLQMRASTTEATWDAGYGPQIFMQRERDGGTINTLAIRSRAVATGTASDSYMEIATSDDTDLREAMRLYAGRLQVLGDVQLVPTDASGDLGSDHAQHCVSTVARIRESVGTVVQGSLLRAVHSSGGELEVELTNSADAVGVVFGVALSAGSNGTEIQVATHGMAQVQVNSGQATTAGERVVKSTTLSGVANSDGAPSGGAAIGTFVETSGAGSTRNVWCYLH